MFKLSAHSFKDFVGADLPLYKVADNLAELFWIGGYSFLRTCKKMMSGTDDVRQKFYQNITILQAFNPINKTVYIFMLI